MRNWKQPIHPGEILAGELESIDINGSGLAERIGVPRNRIYQVLRGERGVTADTAIRLGVFFGTAAKFWLNLQKHYELEVAKNELPIGLLQSIIPFSNKKKGPSQSKRIRSENG